MSKSFEELVSLDAENVMQTYARAQVAFVRGEGTQLWDTNGKRYLDFLGGLAVTALGHANPTIAKAISEQANTLLHVSNIYYNENQPVLAERLNKLLGGGGKSFFTNSGAEANECAIKLARRYTQQHSGDHRYLIISVSGSFHGRTLATLAATGQPGKQKTFEPLPTGFVQVPFNNFEALQDAANENVGAVLIEILQGEGGVFPADTEYLQKIRQICDEKGMLLIVDEIQTGFGRTGRWFGFEHAGISPDIVTMAKALGNGMPIGACWARNEVAASFSQGDHGSTFGGQPLATRAALAVVDVLEEIDAPARAQQSGKRLRDGLATLPGVKDIRGLGLLLAAELTDGIDAKAIATKCLEAGLVVNPVTSSALRFAPSLLVNESEIDEALDILRSVLNG